MTQSKYQLWVLSTMTLGENADMQETSTSTPNTPKTTHYLTKRILWAMLFGTICGLGIKVAPDSWQLNKFLTDGILNIGGALFVNLMKMLVVPLVFVSLLCGICNIDDIKSLGKIGVKAVYLFIITTALATLLAVTIASAFHIGSAINLPVLDSIKETHLPSLQQFIIDIVPSNPFQALTNANILQIIIFAIIFGLAINFAGEAGKRITAIFNDLNIIIMKTVGLVLRVTPYGVFCLIAILFAKLGLEIITQLLNYFLTVIAVLVIYTLVVYSFILKFVADLNPIKFFGKMYSVLLFAFSVSSSNATLPLALDRLERKLGVDRTISSLVLSLGINMNKNGTAIMQGVAAIFIANAYHVDIGFLGSIMVVVTTVLAAISTAGVPSVGVLALVIVLKQVGLPVEGIAIILAVDRFLDMVRTSVNVAGNAVVACVIGRQEHKLDMKTYYS